MASASGGIQQSQPPPSPEIREIQTAGRLTNAAARLKELERIKAAYPKASQMARIESLILAARIDLADTVEAVIHLQKSLLDQSQGPRRWAAAFDAAARIMDHPKLKAFDKGRVLAAVLAYRDEAAKAAAGPEAADAAFYLRAFDLQIAKARANAGDGTGALAALDRFKTAGGESQAEYFAGLGDAYAALGRTEDAYGAYLGAALDRFPGAADKARAMYEKLHGSSRGFESYLDSLHKSLPFTPEPYKPSPGWKGKAVLAELFTGSEGPSCLGADLAFAGLIQAYPAKSLAVLEYHLPLLGPDPMTNPAAKRRQDYYGIRRVPTAIIDGEMSFIGGGARRMSATIFKQYRSSIDARASAEPGVQIFVEAARTGDVVTAEFKVKKYLPGAAVFVVLAQSEVSYKGASGTIVHRLVVRDIVERDPAASGKTVFDLAAAEKAADAVLTDIEKTSAAGPNFKFAERHAAIDRQNLLVVVFVQDKETKKVLNAVVADVR